ncbi:alpha-(1,3)-fucosyltransferase C-like [Penaeus vannamei]|uniref:alpha-(1,3)-fucosyltransferase C-like n=1 Tax=Penaeus vannamei TaxID=6689 RepID=UPI00387F9657
MSQLLPQFSSVKCPFVLCVAVTLAVGFYNYLVVEWDSEVMQQVQNQSFLLQNATQKLESVGVAREKVVLEDRRKPRVVVFWGKWFNAKWAARKGTLTRFGTDSMDELRADGCPEWRCVFTYDRKKLPLADAVLFTSEQFSPARLPSRRPPSQRWVWADVEAPMAPPARGGLARLSAHNASHLVNWTMTYHESSDIVAYYGYFRSLNASVQYAWDMSCHWRDSPGKGCKLPLRPNLIENHDVALERYRRALARKVTLEQVIGPGWRAFVKRPRLVAWMSSHCPTISKREEYVRELAKYIPVDTYGRCGARLCEDRHPLKPGCWLKTMRHYLFYMAMENNLCDQYITEKLYHPLVHNLVPVVWGGSNYSHFLPPNSYIDARQYHPKELAELLLKLSRDPVAYGRYHVWRGFWEARVGGSLCELCYRLHRDASEKHHVDIPSERRSNGRCIKVEKNLFGPASEGWRKVIDSRNRFQK